MNMPTDQGLTPSEYGQLRAFVAVARRLSFARAAEELGVTAPALSQTLRALEGRLGTRLLNRTTRSVSLTDAGVDLLERAGPSIDHLAGSLQGVRERGGRIVGTVRLHAFRIAAEHVIRPMLAAFHREFPDVVVDLSLDDHVTDIVAGRFDAALRVGEVIDKDIVAIPIGGPLRHVAVASPSYLERHAAPVHPRDLVDHACIGWRWPGHVHPYRWEFMENGRWFDVAVSGPLIVDNREFAVQMAAEGVGIAFATEEWVRPFVARGELIPVLTDWSAPFPGFYLCYPSQREMAPALRAFIDALKACHPM
jgi:DNA-binding transcriptional LysR family regulator